jgi:ABC-type multidrug transport system fused ATPase/permease subunit
VTIVLLVFEWKLALIALAITPVLVVLAYRYSHVAHPTLRDVQQKLADVATVAEENIVGVHVVKSFAQEAQERAKFERRSEAVFAQTIRANRQRALYVPLIAWIPLIAQGAVLLVGARMVTSGELTVGGFVAFNLYLGLLVVPLRSLGMWIGQSQRATAAGERIFEIMDAPEEIADLPGAIELPPGGGRLQFEHVDFEYMEGRPTLEDIELDVPAGRTIALIGHTGSGKTTLTSLVPALLRRHRRPRAGRRRRRPRRAAALAPQGDRRHPPGPLPLLRDRSREHHLRRPALSDDEVVRIARLAQATSSSSACRTATTP